MSVYIKSMALPDRCFSCPLCDTDCCGISRGSYIEYRDVDVDVALNSRPDWCPLIPVPDHGRLIDADSLGFVLMDCENADQALWRVDEAPTIIPASKEEQT